MTNPQTSCPADEVLPIGKMAILGFQHVLVMYASAVAVPLIIGGALHLSKEQVAFLVSADLFVSGIVTLVQTVGVGWFGIKLPIMMGMSFTGIGAMISIGANPALGLPGVFGAMLVAGCFCLAISPWMGRLQRLFPQVVVGAILLTIGVSLLDVSSHWIGGGFDAHDFGNPLYIAISCVVLLLILLLTKFARGFLGNIAILVGVAAGMCLCVLLGLTSFREVNDAPWFGFIAPFHFGGYKFEFWSILTMTIVMLVNTIETGGVFIAVSEMVEKPITKKELANGFRADALGALLGALFNVFPYTSYSENVGLLMVTGVRSRWAVAIGACFLILLGLLPKLSIIVASIPVYVLGGVAMIMFGMISVAGIRILGRLNMDKNPVDSVIVAISVGVGMAPVLAPTLFTYFPKQLEPLLQSGVVLGAITAIVLNLFFNGVGKKSRSSLIATEAVN